MSDTERTKRKEFPILKDYPLVLMCCCYIEKDEGFSEPAHVTALKSEELALSEFELSLLSTQEMVQLCDTDNYMNFPKAPQAEKVLSFIFG